MLNKAGDKRMCKNSLHLQFGKKINNNSHYMLDGKYRIVKQRDYWMDAYMGVGQLF